MYESPTGERYTLYTSRATTQTTQMRYATRANDGALYWADRGVGYVLSGPESNKDRLQQVARSVYDQTEKNGG
jgi:anti-sigma factor RsiW